ncbi:MAG TPA: hypothetical protein VOA87_11880, partial [Thermoanaerobaculia bacterium]|nr:hypothetical protein [Thermoanaerobaculia bacterium]
NRDLQVPRNRLRHRVLPALAGPGESSAADLARRLARLARSAAGAGRAIDRRLAGAGHGADRADGADFSAASDPGEIAIGRRELALLAPELRPLALAALHRRAGAPYPAGRAARLELERQLERQLEKGGRVGCDCGGGWRWEAAGERLVLRRAGPRAPSSTFPYTQEVPAGGAAVAVPERPGTTEVTTG